MAEPLILVFDLGTQSIRALLVNPQGEIVQMVQKVFDPPYFSRQPDWAEQKPEFYWQSLCETSRALQEKAGPRCRDIIALTCATIRDTCLCLDRDNNPLGDVILWLDRRKVENLPPLPLAAGIAISLAGMGEGVALQRRISHCNWIAFQEPERWARTGKFVFISTWLNYKLCGNLADSNAGVIGHVPFNSRTRTWMSRGDIRRLVFAVDDERLFSLAEPGAVLGTITVRAAEETGLPQGLPPIPGIAFPRHVAAVQGYMICAHAYIQQVRKPLPSFATNVKPFTSQ
jgi:sugar (pentulose or hexulose) kinase